MCLVCVYGVCMCVWCVCVCECICVQCVRCVCVHCVVPASSSTDQPEVNFCVEVTHIVSLPKIMNARVTRWLVNSRNKTLLLGSCMSTICSGVSATRSETEGVISQCSCTIMLLIMYVFY